VIHAEREWAMHEAEPLSQRSMARSAPAKLPGKRAWRGTALWVTLCVVGGAIGWQAVDLTGFVAGMVRKPGGEASPELRQAHAGAPIDTGSLPRTHRVDQARCTSLALDRSANRILAGRCPEEGLTLRLEGDSDRGDLPRVAGNEAR
jgi:hypothetical protein